MLSAQRSVWRSTVDNGVTIKMEIRRARTRQQRLTICVDPNDRINFKPWRQLQ